MVGFSIGFFYVFTRGYGPMAILVTVVTVVTVSAARVWGDSDTESGSEPSRTEAWVWVGSALMPACGWWYQPGRLRQKSPEMGPQNGKNGKEYQVTPIVLDWWHTTLLVYNSGKSEWYSTRNLALFEHLQCIPCETPSPRERLGRCSVLTRQLALSVIEPLGISRGPCGDKSCTFWNLAQGRILRFVHSSVLRARSANGCGSKWKT